MQVVSKRQILLCFYFFISYCRVGLGTVTYFASTPLGSPYLYEVLEKSCVRTLTTEEACTWDLTYACPFLIQSPNHTSPFLKRGGTDWEKD